MYRLVHHTLNEEKKMKSSDVAYLLFFGLAIWIIGTVYYQFRGPVVLETSSARYWINFILSPVLSAALCIAILRARHIPGSAWASAALLLALPGMFGEALLLSHFATFMPKLHPASAGRYGAFLFAAYALVLTIAETITLKSSLQ
jgi:hypothetical protein